MMSTEKVYSIDVETGDVQKRLIEIAESMDANSQAIRDYQKIAKENGKLTAEQTTEIARLRQANSALGAEQRNLVKIQNEQTRSLNQQRAQLIALRTQWDKMKGTSRENSEEGKRLQKQINDLNASVSGAEQSTGRFQRNVGNYTNAIKEALVGTGKFGKGIDAVGMAVKGNPLFLMVGLLSAIVTGFSRAQPLIDLFAEQMSGISAIFDVLIGRAGQFFNGIMSILSGDISGGLEQMKNSFTGIGDSISRAYEFGVAYEQVMKGITDALERLSVTEARNAATIAQLNKQLRDRTKSEAERIKIAEQIQKLEKETFDLRDQELRKQANLERSALRNALIDKGFKDVEKADAEELIKLAQDAQIEDAKWQKLQQSLIAIYNNEAASLGLIEAAQGRINMIREQGQEQEAKAAEKRDAQLAKEAAASEALAKMQAALGKAERDASLKAIQTAFNEEEKARREQLARELVDVAGNVEQEKLVRQQANDELAMIRAMSLQRQIQELEDYADSVEGTEEMLAAKQMELDELMRNERIRGYEEEFAARNALADKQLKMDLERNEAFKQAFITLSQQIGQDVANLVENFEGTFDEFLRSTARAILNTTLDAIEKALLAQQIAAIAQTTIQEVATKGPVGLLTAALNIALIKSAFAVGKRGISEALGFADGGIIPRGHELPYSNSKGDNVPILAQADEMILNPKQQAKVRQLAGPNIFSEAGVPGANRSGAFAGGGIVAPVIQSPQFNPMEMLEIFRQANISVSVKEFNSVNSRVRARETRNKL